MSKIPHMIRAIHDPYPPKIVVILRDPVARFYSHYKMSWLTSGRRATYPSVEEIVQKDLDTLLKKGALYAPPFSNSTTVEWNETDFAVGQAVVTGKVTKSAVGRGLYAPQVQNYLNYFPLGTSLKVIHYENFTKNKIEGLNDLLEFIVGSGRGAGAGAASCYHHNFTEEELSEDRGPQHGIKKWYPSMTNETRKYLEYIYKPFNDELVDLLGESWRNPW